MNIRKRYMVCTRFYSHLGNKSNFEDSNMDVINVSLHAS